MFNYFLRKISYALLVLLGVVVVIFILFKIQPIDAAKLTLGQQSDKKSLQAIRHEFYLDQPAYKQFFFYLNDISPLSVYQNTDEQQKKYHFQKLITIGTKSFVLKFPYLRRSYQTNEEVTTIIAKALPGTILLAISAIIFAAIIGIFLGVVAAVKQNTWFDHTALFIATAGISLPSFFMGLIVAWLFGFVLHNLTGLSMTGSWLELNEETVSFQLNFKNLILPMIALGIRPVAVITQITRSSMLDVLHSDFIRTAKAKGLAQPTVIFKHALRNALNPVITTISGWLGELLAGAFFIETIFSWKGMGLRTVEALDKFDFPVVMGAVLVTACLFVVINLLTDFIYGIFDPRISVTKK